MKEPMIRTTAMIALTFAMQSLYAQTEGSVFTSTGRAASTTFATDYQCLGINPSNLGWKPKYEGKNVAFGLLEVGLSIYSEALTKKELRDQFLKTDHTFTDAERVEAAHKIADAGLTMNGDVTILGVAFGNDKLGTFGFSVHDRAQWTSTMNPLFSEILFSGYQSGYFDHLVLNTGDTIPNLGNLQPGLLAQVAYGYATNPQSAGDLFNGTTVKFNWYREYNLSYGRQLIDGGTMKFYGGVGLKYLSGMGIIDMEAKNGGISMYSAMSPYFDISYGAPEQSNPSAQQHDKSFPPMAVGHGFALDLGVSMIIKDHLKFGASITNIGSITWTGNEYQATNADVNSSIYQGIKNYNFFDGIDHILGDHSPIAWGGVKEERTVTLPSVMRLGTSLALSDKFEVGADAVFPMNKVPGNYTEPVVGLGGDFKPIPWLQLSAGLSGGGNYDMKIPVGITAVLAKGTYEAGVASRDAVTFFAQDRPTLSICTGFLRFRF